MATCYEKFLSKGIIFSTAHKDSPLGKLLCDDNKKSKKSASDKKNPPLAVADAFSRRNSL